MVLAALVVATSQTTFNVLDFGAVGDGKTMCTKAIQKAIDSASNSRGSVSVPPGNYLTGTLHLRSNIVVRLDPGATILGSTNRNDYDKTFWYAVVAGEDVQNVTITGGGKIDGQGAALAKDVVHKVATGEIKLARKSWRPPEQERPEIIEIQRGSNIRLQNVTIANAACWVQQY